jgi:hypothetical protein
MNFSDKRREAVAPTLIFGVALMIAIGVRAYATSAREISSFAKAPNQSSIENTSTNDAPRFTASEKHYPVEGPADQVSSHPHATRQPGRIAFGSEAFACQTENGVLAVTKVLNVHDPKRMAKALKSKKCIAIEEGANATLLSTEGNISKFILHGKTLYTLVSMARRL